jgi:hypothetical protein
MRGRERMNGNEGIKRRNRENIRKREGGVKIREVKDEGHRKEGKDEWEINAVGLTESIIEIFPAMCGFATVASYPVVTPDRQTRYQQIRHNSEAIILLSQTQ